MSTAHRPRWAHAPHSALLTLALLAMLLPTTDASYFADSWLPSRRAAIPPVVGSDNKLALPEGSLMAGTSWVCKELGECQPCPKDQLSTPVCSFYGHRRQLSCTPLHPTSSNPFAAANKNARPASHEHGYHNPDDDPTDPTVDEDDRLLAALTANRPAPTAKTGHSLDNFRPPAQDKDEFKFATGVGQEDEFDANPPSPQGEGDQLDAGVDEAILEAEEEWAEGGVELVGERGRGRWRRQGRVDEVRTWEACGKVVSVERKDFGEFVMCNLFFAVASVATLSYRYRHLASRQYGTLVARLGMSVSQN